MHTRHDRPARRPVTPRPPLVRPGRAALAASALLLLGAATEAATIYRTVAPDGTVVFSDRPAPDATVVETKPLNVVGTGADGRAPGEAAAGGPDGATAPAPVSPVDGPARAEEAAAPAMPSDDIASGQPSPDTLAAPLPVAIPPDIDEVVIASPPPEAILFHGGGPVILEIGTAPGPLSGSGLRVEALVDGEVVASGTSSMLAVPTLERGEHTLQVRLVGADDEPVVASAIQSLHVRRTVVADTNPGDD